MRHAKHAIYCLAALYLIGTLLGGIGLGWIALHPPRHSATPAEVRNVKATIERSCSRLGRKELSKYSGEGDEVSRVALFEVWEMSFLSECVVPGWHAIESRSRAVTHYGL